MSRLVTIDAEVYESLQQEVIQLRQEVSDRKRAQLQLQEILRQLTENIPDCFFIGTVDQSRFFYISPAYETIWGQSLDSLYQNPLGWRDAIHPEDRDRASAATQPGQGSGQLEYRIIRPDGAIRWISTRTWPMLQFEGEGNLIVGLAQDVTSEKLAEQALRQSEQRYQTIINSIYSIIWEVSLHPYQTTFISQPVEEILGYPQTYWLEQGFWQNHIHPDDREWVMQYRMAAIEQHRDHTLEYRLIAADGRVVWLRDNVRVVVENQQAVKLLGTTIDITERKQAEAMLRQREALLNEVQAIGRVGGWELEIDLNRQQIITAVWTDEMYRIHELPSNTNQIPVLTSLESYFSFYPSHVQPEIIEAFQTIFATGQPLDLEVPFITAKRRHCWVKITAKVAFRHDDTVRLVGCLMDITQAKQAELDLRQLNEELEHRVAIRTADLRHRTEEIEALCYAFPDLVFRVAADGTYLELKTRGTEDLYIELQNLIGRRVQDVLPAPVGQECYKVIQQALHTQTLASLEYSLMIAESEQHFEVRIVPLHAKQVIAIVRNISDRKQAEESLQQSKARLQRLVASLPDAVFQYVIHPNGSKMKAYASPRYQEIYGVTPEAIMQDPDLLWSLIHPDDFERVQQAVMDVVAQPQRLDVEFRSYTRSGELKWIRAIAQAERQTNGDVVLDGIELDITEQKQVDAALRQSEARLQRVLQHMPVLLDAFDEAGNIIVWNQECERVTGYTAGEMVGNPNAMKWLYPNVAYRQQMMLTNAVRGNRYRNWEWELTCKDGTTRTIAWSNVSGQCPIPGWSNWAIGVDVTERKQAERALQESEERFRRMFEDTSIGIALCSSEGHFIRVNPAFCQLLGYIEAELMEMNFRQITHPDDLEREEVLITQCVHQGHNHYQIEKRYLKRSGETIWVNASISMIRGDAEQDCYGMAIVKDISDRKRTQDALQLSRDLFEAVFQESADVIFLVDPETRLILDSNRRSIELFEANSKADLIGLPGHLLQVEPYTTTERDRVWSHLLEQGIWTMEREFQTYRGHRFWGSFAAKLIQVAGRQMSLVRITDISDRKQAERILEQRIQRERLIKTISLQIRQSLELEQILATTVTEVRELLQADRVLIFRLPANHVGHVIQESVAPEIPATIDMLFPDEHFPEECYAFYCQGFARIVQNALNDEWGECLSKFMGQIGVKSKIVAPIVQQIIEPESEVSKLQESTSSTVTPYLWGLLIAHTCSEERQWQPSEVDLLQQLATQVGIAIQQADLYSQLRKELVQREILLKEIHHRVKNNLQIVSAMLGLQSESVQHPAIRSVLEDSETRLQAMALIHETLYQSSNLRQLNFSDYVQRLVSSILMLNHVHSESIHLTYRLESISLNLETAIPCGLLLNELVTNVIKHAFPDHREGEVRIELIRTSGNAARSGAKTDQSLTLVSRQFRSSEQLYVLSVQDHGIGMPENFDLANLKSLGLKIACDLTVQLRGRLELKTGQGTKFTLTFAELMYLKRF
jgi:PAS domain S-box-containing protein